MSQALVVLVLACRREILANPDFLNAEVRRGFDGQPCKEVIDTLLPGKAANHNLRKTVPQTDTGGQVEHTKALERTRVKELGKMVP